MSRRMSVADRVVSAALAVATCVGLMGLMAYRTAADATAVTAPAATPSAAPTVMASAVVKKKPKAKPKVKVTTAPKAKPQTTTKSS